MAHFKGKNYSAPKPSFNQCGASTSVYFNDDSYMELDVDMTWNGHRDELEIEQINADYYDSDDIELSTDDIDLTQIVIDICEHFNTFGSVENEMAKSYHADHA